MKNSALTILISIVGLVGCKYDSPDDLPVLMAGSAIDNRRAFDLAEIVDRFELIPLSDDGEKSLIGNITKMQESESKFYISDGVRNPVKIFDKNGRFLSSRGTIGRGPDELPFISNFAVDHRRDNIYLFAASAGVIITAVLPVGTVPCLW